MIETKKPLIISAETYSDRELSGQISKFYSLPAERAFIDVLRQKNVDERQINLYSREQVLKFLLEFAAGVKKTHITYELNDRQQLIYPNIGLVMEEMMQQAVINSGGGRRERAELIGWQKTQALLAEGQVNQVLQLSPPDPNNPNHGDYGFLFWFEKHSFGNEVTSHILRYYENELSSAAFGKALGLSGDPLNLANSLLAQPRGINAESDEIRQQLANLNLSFDNRGSLLEQALLKDSLFLMAWQQYQQALLRPNFDQNRSQAALVKMYRLAQNKAATIGLLDRRMLPSMMFMAGSCPIIQAGLSVYNYADYLYYEPFTCPSCGHVSWSPVGNQCPSCKITKEEWAEMQKDNYEGCE